MGEKKKEKVGGVEKGQYPIGVFGFLSRLRDSGVLNAMPPSWCKIMLAFLSHRNPQGYCWPSQRTIAKEAGCHTRTVKRFIDWAKASLGWQVSRSKFNSYYIPLNEEVDNWFPSNPKKREWKGTAGDTKEDPRRRYKKKYYGSSRTTVFFYHTPSKTKKEIENGEKNKEQHDRKCETGYSCLC